MLGLSLHHIASPQVVTLDARHTLYDALKKMSEKDVHSIIVTDDARFRIVTTRALVTLQLAGVGFNTLLADASLPQVKCVKSSVAVSDALMMLEGSYSQHLCLIDDHCNLQGIISYSNIIKSLDPELFHSDNAVGEIGSLIDFTEVIEGVSLKAAMLKMHIAGHTSCVVRMHDQTLGIITQTDMLKALLNGADLSLSINNFASFPLVSIRENCSFSEALASIQQYQHKRLGVVNEFGNLVGLLHQKELVIFLIEHWRELGLQEEARTQSAQTIFENEQRWKAVLEGTHQGVWDWNARTNKVYFSPIWKSMLGYRDDEIGDSLSEWESRIHPDDIAEVYADLERHFSGQTLLYENTHRVRCKDGSYKWILDKGQVFTKDDDGKPVRVIGSHTDVTEAYEQKLKFDQLAENTPGMLYQFRFYPDGTSCFPFSTQGMLDVYGYTPEQVVSDASIVFDRLHADDLEAVKKSIEYSAHHLSVWHLQYRYVHPSKGVIWLEGRASPTKMQDESILWNGYINDITEYKQDQLMLEETRKRFELTMEATDTGLWSWDLSSNQVIWSDITYQQLGYQSSELDMSLATFEALMHPDDLNKTMGTVKKSIQLGQSLHAQFRLLHADGSWVWIQSRGKVTVFNQRHQPIYMMGTHTNITHSKLIETELGLSRERLMLATESAGLGVWEYDIESGLLSWDDQMFELYGVFRLTFKHRLQDWLSLVLPDHRSEVLGHFQEALREHSILSFTFPIRRSLDNRISYLHCQARVVRKVNGDPMRVVGVNRDVTATEKAAELARFIEERNTRYRTALDQIALTIAAKDEPLSILASACESMAKALNADRGIVYKIDLEEQKILGVTEWLKQINSKKPLNVLSDLDLDLDLLANSMAHMRETTDWIVSHQHTIHPLIKQDGFASFLHEELAVKSLSWFPFNFSDESFHILVFNWLDEFYEPTAEDKLFMASVAQLIELALVKIKLLTEQRSIEYRLKLFMQESTVGVFVTDQSGHFTQVNRAGCEMLGYAVEELLTLSISDLYPYEYESHQKELNDALQRDGSVQTEVHLSHKQGHTVPVAFSGVAIDQFGVMAFCTDISERINHERALKEAMLESEQANRAKSEFLANMSHEIRTPMNGIIGLSQYAHEINTVSVLQDRLIKVNQSGRLLLGIINDILDFSKIESGKLTIDPQPFVIANIVSHLKMVFEELAANKNIELKFNIDSKALRGYVGDELRLRQVLTNLLGNALKFTHKGSVTLSINEQKQLNNNGLLKFSVQDTGIGISEEQQQRLFQAFSQADTKITRNYGGSGLGLVISQRLLEAMGSQGIQVVSHPKQGSEFSFSLALQPCSDDQMDELIAQQEESILPDQFKGRVLIVEDNVINQEVAKNQLTRLGLEVDLADDGQVAVQMLRDASYDLVLMDIQMPFMDGYEATRLLRQQGYDRPIIALTAAALIEDQHKALASGMNDHLSKPIDPSTLNQMLARWLPHITPADWIDLNSADLHGSENTLAEKMIDLDQGMALMSGNKPLYFKLLGKFARQLTEERDQLLCELAQLNIDSDSHQFDAMQKRVHGLKGVCGNLAIVSLYDALVDLDQSLKRKNLFKSHDLERLTRLIDATLTELQTLLTAVLTSEAELEQTHNTLTPQLLLELKQLQQSLSKSEFVAEKRLHAMRDKMPIEVMTVWLTFMEAIEQLDYDQALVRLGKVLNTLEG
ncbi:PAS domain-containing protein [Nitrincola schmidtii]|uniref:PAS domain-containing protein n=1 Tax=Nitrincola schmidtii TaxID=1730894 RepID=UPI00124DB108|nr:PAS domain-containing protein [Nitrincola schmidtii]